MHRKKMNSTYLSESMKIKESDLTFHDIREFPFSIHGFCNSDDEGTFARIPEYVAKNTSEEVYGLYKNTAVGRIRFATDWTVWL